MAHLRSYRLLETIAGLDRLRDDVRLWQTHRTESDLRGQYRTQLNALVSELEQATCALRQEVSTVSAISCNGDYFTALLAHDRRAIWLRSAWSYYRDRFDQRDDPSLGPTLRAADEVLWSCYKPFFSAVAVPAAPLCCVDSAYVPSALRPDQARHLLGRTDEVDRGPLAPFLKTLPIPILRLPASVVSAPWSLALIAHETGHFIQRAVPDAEALYVWLEKHIVACVAQEGGNDADVSDWRAWTEEIFADLYASVTVGKWAIWALAPWMLGPSSFVLARQRSYPSPLVRLRLLAAACDAIGVEGASALCDEIVGDGVATVEDKRVELDLRVAARVGQHVLAALPDKMGALPDRVNFFAREHCDGQAVEKWAAALSGGPARDDNNELRTARLVAAAALQASHTAAQLEPAAQADALAALRERVPARIAACFEKGKRDAPADSRPPEQSLAALVLGLGDEHLMPVEHAIHH